MITKHVCMYSGGAGSAWVAKYLVDHYGPHNVILLNTDTQWEDEDNYRFMNDVSDYIGVPVTYTSDGRTPEDVFRQEMFFGNFGTAPCSKQLKMKQTFVFVQFLISQGILPILYFGIDYKEVRRAPRIAYNYKHNVDVFEDGVETRFPLVGEVDGIAVNGQQLLYGTDYLNEGNMPTIYNNTVYSCLDKQDFVKCEANVKKEIEEVWRIKLPRMYELGFAHANCGGMCIKAGKKHFANLHKVWPDRFKKLEKIEKEINDQQLEKNNRRYTILSKDIDGNKSPYSLEEYRLNELEKSKTNLPEQLALNLFDEEDAPCECVF